jgi:diguanylate cyclase (GGDEF)-like protein
MCGCIIHDFEAVYDDLQIQEDEALRRKANCDFLTGFYNRFYLNEMHNIFNHKINTGITFLDINNLKVTNDTQGHQAGDELIVKISNMIRSLYSDSIVFRIGGDEFVIITEGRTEEDFVKMSDNAKAFFEKNNLAAIGYRYYERIYNLKECVEECDKLMYDEKRYMKGM